MLGRIIFHQTNIKFDQNFIQKLNENSGGYNGLYQWWFSSRGMLYSPTEVITF